LGTVLPFSTAVTELIDTATGIGKSFSIEDDRLVGAVVVSTAGMQKECEKYLSFIKEKGSLKEVDEFTRVCAAAADTAPAPLPATEAPASPHPEDIG
jgi:hypothetical protein